MFSILRSNIITCFELKAPNKVFIFIFFRYFIMSFWFFLLKLLKSFRFTPNQRQSKNIYPKRTNATKLILNIKTSLFRKIMIFWILNNFWINILRKIYIIRILQCTKMWSCIFDKLKWVNFFWAFFLNYKLVSSL